MNRAAPMSMFGYDAGPVTPLPVLVGGGLPRRLRYP
jgi:hypothetical protein